MEFSEKIRLARIKLGMSQEGLAHALNVSFATINRWENSKNKPVRMAQVAFNEFCKEHKISFGENEGN